MIDLKRSLFMGIVGGILGGAIFLVARLLKQPALRDSETGDLLVRYSPLLGWFIGILWAFVVVSFGIAALVVPFKSQKEFFIVMSVGPTLLLLTGLLFLHLFKIRIHVSEEGLEYHGLMGRPKSIPWSEVSRVKFTSDGSFVVTAANKTSIKIQPMMQGRAESIGLVEQRIPAEVVEACDKQFQKYHTYLQNSASMFGQKNSLRE